MFVGLITVFSQTAAASSPKQTLIDSATTDECLFQNIKDIAVLEEDTFLAFFQRKWDKLVNSK